jgi:predicted DNA-binding protein (MmcQ/YjbR family)
MLPEEIREYCLSLKGTQETIKWENHLCFTIAEKMYFVMNPDETPVSCSFKTSEELFDDLTSRDGFIPAPYMAKNKWVHLDNVRRLSKKEGVKLIEIAYQLILAKLPLKTQKLLLQDNSREKPSVRKSKSK